MSATWYQSWLRATETVQLAEDQRLSLTASGATGYTTQEAVILSDGVPLDVFDANAYNQAVALSRASASTFLNTFGGELAACFAELAKVIAVGSVGVPQTQPTQVLPLLYRYMAVPQAATVFANPTTDGGVTCAQVGPLVNSRNLTRGTPSYGASNVGTGVLYRLTVDAYGFPLEGDYAETLNATCVLDAQSGTLTGQEQFTVIGQPFRDALTWFASGYGSGLSARGAQGFVGVTADTTQSLIQNSSFSRGTGTNFTNWVVTGWTQSSGLATALGIDTVNYYRAAAIEGTAPAALKFQSSATITQLISSNALAITAFLNQLAWNGSIGTWSGSFTVTIGSKSWSVSSGATGWQTVRPTINKNLWFQNFNQAALAVTIAVTIASGTLLVDDFCWAPFQQIGGKLFWLIGGQTAFLVNDTINVADTEPSPPSKTQNWIRLMFPGFYLPSAVLPAAPVAAPVVADSGVAGAVTNGGHLCWVSFVNATAESGLGPRALVNIASNDKVAWSSIPTGGVGITARGLYRSKTGDIGPGATPRLVAYINDNITTVYTDNVADAALTKQSPSAGDPVN